MGGLSEDIEGQLRGQRSVLERAEAAVAEQPHLETLLSEVSAQLLNLPVMAVNPDVEQGLQRLAECLDVEQGTLFALSEDSTQLRAIHTWAVRADGPGLAPVNCSRCPWATEKLRRGETVQCSPLPDLPDAATCPNEDLRRGSLESVLVFPLAVAGSITQAIALSSLRAVRMWPDGAVQQLQVVGEVFANALSVKQAHELLQTAYAELSKLRQQLQGNNHSPHGVVTGEEHAAGMIGQSDVFRGVLFRVGQVASSNRPVLLLGETGVGKELLAQAIHQRSLRSARPFVTVNCAALSATLIESELFGHEKGAFTGAAAQRVGRFEAAHGGTLFLDEIGDLPLELQGKLLRALENGEFERVGSSRTLSVDVRVIAATNHDLEADMRGGRFRPDLYYRLAVFPITVPPLKDRREDIPLLAHHFVTHCAEQAGKAISTVPEGVMKTLQAHTWPGNIRELRNVIERAVLITQGPSLRLMDRLQAPAESRLAEPRDECQGIRSLAVAEAEHIRRALEELHWKIEGKGGAAAALGLPASTLRKRMRKLGIQRPEIR